MPAVPSGALVPVLASSGVSCPGWRFRPPASFLSPWEGLLPRFSPQWAGTRFRLVIPRGSVGGVRTLFPAEFDRVSPISTPESPAPIDALAAYDPAGMRVARFHVGIGFGSISHVHLAL